MTGILVFIIVVAAALVVVLLALMVLLLRRARTGIEVARPQRSTPPPQSPLPTPPQPRPSPPRSQQPPQAQPQPPPTIDRAAQKIKRGNDAESRVAAILDGLPADYRAYHELYPTEERSMRLTEVDHVVISPFGIFVIETKGIFGEVFVNPHTERWRIARPQRDDSMPNPLRQNDMHRRAIASSLGCAGRSWVRSIVCFADDATRLRGVTLENVLTHDGLRHHIVGYQTAVLNDDGVNEAIGILDDLDARTPQLAPIHARQLDEDSRLDGS